MRKFIGWFQIPSFILLQPLLDQYAAPLLDLYDKCRRRDFRVPEQVRPRRARLCDIADQLRSPYSLLPRFRHTIRHESKLRLCFIHIHFIVRPCIPRHQKQLYHFLIQLTFFRRKISKPASDKEKRCQQERVAGKGCDPGILQNDPAYIFRVFFCLTGIIGQSAVPVFAELINPLFIKVSNRILPAVTSQLPRHRTESGFPGSHDQMH